MTGDLLHDLLDRRAAETPDAMALRWGEHGLSYTELQERSVVLAARLRAGRVGRGDRVLIVDHRDGDTVAAAFAAARLGAVFVVIDDRLPAYYLDHIVADCSPKAVVGEGRTARESGVPVLPPGPGAEPAADETVLSTDPVSLIYTSGSTALPKAVVSTHQQVLSAIGAIQSRLRYRNDDVVLCCLPISFDYGLYQAFLACTAGATVVLGGAVEAGAMLLRRMIDERVTVFPLVPSLAVTLCRLTDRLGTSPADLRLITNTGAALPATLIGRLRASVPSAAIVAMFGLTECKRVSIAEPDLDLVRPGSVGRPLPGTEVAVVGPDGEPLPAGEVGEFTVRGPHVMAGYWNAPDLTAARFRRDYLGRTTLHTGDYGRLDDDGYLYFSGRRDDVYKQNGLRISTTEVEAAALDVSGVELALAFPPDNTRPARLAVSGNITSPQLLAGLRARMDGRRIPADCLVLAEMPLTGNGKVDRRAVAARWETDAVELS